jgi:hypothetical protein
MQRRPQSIERGAEFGCFRSKRAMQLALSRLLEVVGSIDEDG